VRTVVVSLCWGTAWDRYGKNFVETFHRYWPANVHLMMVSDRAVPLPRGEIVDLFAIEGFYEFHGRWDNNRRAKGLDAPTGSKVDDNGYSWKFDAIKWMPQALAPVGALQSLADGDIICWFDADVVTTRPVPDNWVQSLLEERDIAMLQRGRTHSEIGFYAVRVGTRTRQLLRRFADFYRTDDVFALKEWHSAYVFDRALEFFPDITVNNLNRDNGKGHVWPRAHELSRYTAHLKGKRKDKR